MSRASSPMNSANFAGCCEYFLSVTVVCDVKLFDRRLDAACGRFALQSSSFCTCRSAGVTGGRLRVMHQPRHFASFLNVCLRFGYSSR